MSRMTPPLAATTKNTNAPHRLLPATPGRHTATFGALLLAATLLTGCNSNSLLRRQAVEAIAKNDIPLAETKLNQAIYQDPSDWRALMYLGEVRLKQNEGLDAQLLLDKALALRPSHEETPRICDGMAEAYLLQKDNKALHAFLQRCVDQYGKPADYLRQALYLAKSGDKDGADVAFKKAVHFWPKGQVTPYIKMADFYESISDTENAVASLRKALAIKPESPRIKRRLTALGATP